MVTEACTICGATPATRQFENGSATDRFACYRHMAQPTNAAKRRRTPKLKDIPSIEQLENWMSDSGCEATDGCWVEPDGACPHGKPSWLIALDLI